jgi:hypothetical protein
MNFKGWRRRKNGKYVFIFYDLQGRFFVCVSDLVLFICFALLQWEFFLHFACIATGVCTCILGLALRTRSGTSDRVTLNKAIPQATIECRTIFSISIECHNTQGATTVGWMYYIPATRVARLTRGNTRHCHVSKWKGPSIGEGKKTQFVEFVSEPSRRREISLYMNGLSTLWNGTKHMKRLRKTSEVKGRTKCTAKCGKKRLTIWSASRNQCKVTHK